MPNAAADVIAVSAFDDAALSQAAPQGGQAWIEDPTSNAGDHAIAVAEAGGLVVDLRAATAFNAPVAAIFCRWLRSLGVINAAHDSAGLELMIHEALSNAVIHGDFGLHDDWRRSAAAFRARSEAIKSALDDPTRADRRVTLGATWCDGSVEIIVADQGDGYDDDVADQGRDRPHRGLGILANTAAEWWVEDGGRVLRMRFSP